MCYIPTAPRKRSAGPVQVPLKVPKTEVKPTASSSTERETSSSSNISVVSLENRKEFLFKDLFKIQSFYINTFFQPLPAVKLESLKVDLANTLPEISPNYKPLSKIDHAKRRQELIQEEAEKLSKVLHKKNER